MIKIRGKFSGLSKLKSFLRKWPLILAMLFLVSSCSLDMSNGYNKMYRQMARAEKKSLKTYKKNTRQPKTKAQNKADKMMEKADKEAEKQYKKDLKKQKKIQSAQSRKMMRMARKQAKKLNRDLERKRK